MKFCSGGMLAATRVKMSDSEKKEQVNKNTYETSSIKRVTRTLLDVSRCSRAKRRQRNVQKKVCCTCKLVFFFVSETYCCLFVCLFVCFYRSRCLRCLAFQTERNVTKRQVIHSGSLGSLCGDYHELLAN